VSWNSVVQIRKGKGKRKPGAVEAVNRDVGQKVERRIGWHIGIPIQHSCIDIAFLSVKQNGVDSLAEFAC
jgi:hypothetical protein